MTDFFKDLPEGWPLIAGAALVVVLLAESVYLVFFNASRYRENVNRRLQVQKQVGNRADALIELKRERGIKDGEAEGAGAAFRRLLSQTGLKISLQKVVLAWVATILIVPLAAYLLDRNGPIDLILAVLAGAAIPPFVLKQIRDRRVKKFSEQFPDAIDVIVRSLKAGHPLPIAISLVAREMPDPVGSEFGMVADEISFGLDLETAMRNLYLRVGQEDLPLFVTSISIQAATGGNLAAILEGLSLLIRNRFKMRRKIRALSSEAKFSAYVLIALPFILFGLINVSNPDFFEAAQGKTETTYAIVGSLLWMSIGVLVMRNLVNMKI